MSIGDFRPAQMAHRLGELAVTGLVRGRDFMHACTPPSRERHIARLGLDNFLSSIALVDDGTDASERVTRSAAPPRLPVGSFARGISVNEKNLRVLGKLGVPKREFFSISANFALPYAALPPRAEGDSKRYFPVLVYSHSPKIQKFRPADHGYASVDQRLNYDAALPSEEIDHLWVYDKTAGPAHPWTDLKAPLREAYLPLCLSVHPRYSY